LNKVAASTAVISQRRNSDLAEFAGQIGRSPQFIGCAAAASLHGVAGQSSQLVGNLSGGSIWARRLLAEYRFVQREQTNADRDDNAELSALHFSS